MRKLLLLSSSTLLLSVAFLLNNPQRVESAPTDPCLLCVGYNCVSQGTGLPYCNHSYDECSPAGNNSPDCGYVPPPPCLDPCKECLGNICRNTNISGCCSALNECSTNSDCRAPTSSPTPTPTPDRSNDCYCTSGGGCYDPNVGPGLDCKYSPAVGCGTSGCGPLTRYTSVSCETPGGNEDPCGAQCIADDSCGTGNWCNLPGCHTVEGSTFCADSGCGSCQRQIGIRYCPNPAGPGEVICDYLCQTDTNCGGSCPTPTGTGGPTGTPSPGSCTVDLLPSTTSVSLGSSIGLTAAVTIGSGTVDNVTFTSSNPGVATVNPAVDSTVVYSTQVAGVTTGTVTVTSDVVMGGNVTCTDTSTVDVIPAGPWWQVKDADVTSGGDIISQIPGTCTLPVCNPVFEVAGDGGFPGIPLYAGAAADFQAGSGTGTVADPPYTWLVNATYSSPKSYDFTYFKRQIPSDVIFTEITTPAYNGGDFNSGGAPSRGYVWYHYDGATLGDLTITGNVNLTGSRRVVLLVEGADLYITGLVNLQSPGNGFFMAVVGKDANGLKGNIIVDPSVSHPIQPAMEGIFLAEGEFRTGAGTNQFYFRGSVVGYDGIVLERDLGSANEDTPGEYFEYSPAIMATFPQVFTTRRLRWKEVAP